MNAPGYQSDPPLILLVEDEKMTRMLLRRSLEQEGYRIAEAKDGRQGIEAYQRLLPDLVLLDALMPLMDGFTCCQQLRALPGGDRTPVLMVTALEDAESVDRAFEVGATDYVTKPIHWAVLRQRVRRLLEAKQTLEELHQQIERERLLSTIQERIRQSLHLEEILNTTVVEVRQFLQTDRVLIFRFEPDWSGTVVVESVVNGWKPLVESTIHDPCFGENYVGLYRQGRILAIEDIYTANLGQCHLNLLAQCQVRANLVVPILQDSAEPEVLSPESEFLLPPTQGTYNTQLWGLLIAHHCSVPRRWQSSEIYLLERLATQVAIAIKQAKLYHRLKAAYHELERIASLDGLTQVANRRCFDEYLEREWRRMARDKEPLSLILFDLDYFKPYNDSYGHQAGDACLQEVASAVSRVLKRPSDLLARYGGEEFAIILPNTEIEGAVYIAEQIKLAVKSLAIPHASSTINPYVTLSLGVASMTPLPNSLPTALIAVADKALYQAKAAGRDRIWYDN